MLNAEIVFQPSVFSGEKFPRCDFTDPAKFSKLLGKYRIQSDYYDSGYQRLDRPKSAGRYGAVVKITAEDGQVYTRFRTLYKTPYPFKPYPGMVKGSMSIPWISGVKDPVWKNQDSAVSDYLTYAIGRDIYRSHDFAILLAGLSTLNEQSATLSQVNSPLSKDRQWWLPLKRKLNGNGKKFTQVFKGPLLHDKNPGRMLTKGTAQQAGMKTDAVDKIDAILNQWANDSDQPFNVCVARKGILFFDKAYGNRDGKPITTDTRHIVYSISKALSGSLLMMFVEQGLVSLDDPVEKFLPEFKNENVNQPATIHHLFCHCADMDGHFTDFLNDMEHVYGEAYPVLKIGKQHRYNGTSIGIGCKVLEQISGKTLPTLYKDALFDPLGCQSIESIDGSAMTWSNARDLAIVGQMLANRGQYGSNIFFSEKTFEKMLPRKLNHLLGEKTRINWGIGLTWFREPGFSSKTIGHGSASSCTLRVDLENDLVVTMTRSTAGRNFGKYHPKFIKAVTDSIAK